MATQTSFRRARRLAGTALLLVLAGHAVVGVAAPGRARAQDATPVPTEAPTTPTRRPTRTPRATPLPTATPLPAGGLRVVAREEPALPSVGEPVAWAVTVENLLPAPSGELLLEIVLPAVLVVEGVEVTGGETARDGRVVRWYVPGVPAGASVVLRAAGVAGRATERRDADRGCIQLLSHGAPIEYCSDFAVGERTARGELPSAPEAPALPTAPTGVGLEDAVPPPRIALGLGALVVGLGVLGAWFGTVLRGARPRPIPSPARDAPADDESEAP